jgi:hypothetical protein
LSQMPPQRFLHYKTTLKISLHSWNVLLSIVRRLQLLITKNIKVKFPPPNWRCQIQRRDTFPTITHSTLSLFIATTISFTSHNQFIFRIVYESYRIIPTPITWFKSSLIRFKSAPESNQPKHAVSEWVIFRHPLTTDSLFLNITPPDHRQCGVSW